MSKSQNEPEFKGPFWKHPYVLYIWLTALIFVGMLFIALLAFKSGCIPTSGV